jgi:phosphonate transport system substrate-binding protein
VHKLKKLRVISYLAPNWFDFYQSIVSYFGRILSIEVELEQGKCDPLQDPLLLQNQLDFAFICGLPFIQHHQVFPEKLLPLVAPVMRASRYQNRPIYFSDLIVNANSKIKFFEDLKNKIFCYNDLGSNSGYNLPRYRVIQGGYSQGFFAKTIQSGSHQRSIRWVIEGQADCAAIDSVVLEQELRDFPELSKHLRVIESLGSYPMPPLVVSQSLGVSVIEQLQSAILQPDAELKAAMVKVGVKCFAVVKLEDYELLIDTILTSSLSEEKGL